MAVEEINQTLPQMVNKNTRFNSVTLDEGRVIRYNLTVIGLTADRINRDQLDKSLRPKLINALRTKPEARVFGDLGVTIVLSYKDMNGTFIAQFQITPEEYRE